MYRTLAITPPIGWRKLPMLRTCSSVVLTLPSSGFDCFPASFSAMLE